MNRLAARFVRLALLSGLALYGFSGQPAPLALAEQATAPVELVELDAENWAEYAPQGKEVDAIYGDWVLRNSKIVAVIGRPLAGRHANMSVKNVGGCLIDLTRRDRPNDQLSAYYPGAAARTMTRSELASFAVGRGESQPWFKSGETPTPRRGDHLTLEIPADPVEGKLAAVVSYSLGADDEFLAIDTLYHNSTTGELSEELNDSIRADRVFEFGADRSINLFWAADDWFGQAYGVVTPERFLARDKLLKLTRDGKTVESLTLAPGASATVPRKLFPAASQLAVRGLARRLAGQPVATTKLRVVDPAGPVVHARVAIMTDGEEYGFGRTDADGQFACDLPPGKWEAVVEALGRPTLRSTIESGTPEVELRLQPCGYVAAEIVDAQGRGVPCKVAFYGEGQADNPPRDKDRKLIPRRMVPYFGPDSNDFAVHNLRYSENGKFRQEIPPGKYEVVVSLGPEYDAVFTQLEVVAGQDAPLRATLRRTVDTRGWISADYHNHSSPSGDNVSSQLGRVLNLLGEHIEFAPCTEHNRIDSYQPHLERLRATARMATCTGMELTGGLLPVNHQNAFPLKLRPRTQDGGGPRIDDDPEIQIERLALWDDGAAKLVQMNHPNLVQVFGDRDLDGTPDRGFRKMLGFMDVMEVHPPQAIFAGPPAVKSGPKAGGNRMFYWMQLLNLGYRIPGVVNTDAHYNFHGSGWLRNYVKCSTDDPAQIDVMEMVRASERGHLVMSNGPFLEVSASAGTAAATGDRDDAGRAWPGDDLAAPGGQATFDVRVQCPNWFDINRVQIFVNGRAVPELNWTRRTHPERFRDGVVKFEQRIPLKLAVDSHVIVAAIGEDLQLGKVMGPEQGAVPPVAVANPVFVNVDGGKFQPNGDDLGAPLPGVK